MMLKVMVSVATFISKRSFFAAAGVALVSGAGLALWQHRQGLESSESSVNPSRPADLWGLQLMTPAGALLDMRVFQGKPLLVNFWATWCPPCVEELPLLEQFFRENKFNGWQVLGIAVDKATSVQQFLLKTPLSYPMTVAGVTGAELSRTFGNLTGGLPFSVALAATGQPAYRKMGALTATDLASLRQII
ncbi:MAG: hypothetical protein RLZZ401_1441 [Pseudomonadota bacterium]|jgi:thiol-disulfide isomerase/thioredoxin